VSVFDSVYAKVVRRLVE